MMRKDKIITYAKHSKCWKMASVKKKNISEQAMRSDKRYRVAVFKWIILLKELSSFGSAI